MSLPLLLLLVLLLLQHMQITASLQTRTVYASKRQPLLVVLWPSAAAAPAVLAPLFSESPTCRILGFHSCLLPPQLSSNCHTLPVQPAALAHHVPTSIGTLLLEQIRLARPPLHVAVFLHWAQAAGAGCVTIATVQPVAALESTSIPYLHFYTRHVE